MAAREQTKLWPDTQPVPISTVSTRTKFTMARKATSSSKGNPFSGRMTDTLSKPRAVHEGGNRTANQTVLGAVDRRRSGGYHLSAGNPAKRQKVEQEHDVTSRFWQLNAGAATISGNDKDQGKNKDKDKGKGKALVQPRSGSAQTEPIHITDSDDDIGAPLPQPQKPQKKGAEQESTPDPLDLIGSRGSPENVEKAHDFDRPPDARLPQDGEATRRLRLRTFAEHERTKEPDIVTVDESSEIESASGFDREDEVRQAATPNGRPQIPKGLVQEKIHVYEKKDSGKSVQPQPQSRPPVIRTIDFKLQQPGRGNVKASMKGRGGGSKLLRMLRASVCLTRCPHSRLQSSISLRPPLALRVLLLLQRRPRGKSSQPRRNPNI
ncbi:hypothetical protein BD413DRAFT_62522 [Trametes elegans]|nr:hypothetical protein BD413DRAFT_62522 [Trametes elegans]